MEIHTCTSADQTEKHGKDEANARTAVERKRYIVSQYFDSVPVFVIKARFHLMLLVEYVCYDVHRVSAFINQRGGLRNLNARDAEDASLRCAPVQRSKQALHWTSRWSGMHEWLKI